MIPRPYHPFTEENDGEDAGEGGQVLPTPSPAINSNDIAQITRAATKADARDPATTWMDMLAGEWE